MFQCYSSFWLYVSTVCNLNRDFTLDRGSLNRDFTVQRWMGCIHVHAQPSTQSVVKVHTQKILFRPAKAALFQHLSDPRIESNRRRTRNETNSFVSLPKKVRTTIFFPVWCRNRSGRIRTRIPQKKKSGLGWRQPDISRRRSVDVDIETANRRRSWLRH